MSKPLVAESNERTSPMTNENWQRLKNLSLFKLWVTDKQLNRLWPLAALITPILLTVILIGYFFRS